MSLGQDCLFKVHLDFSIEFALITSMLFNHFGELDDKQIAFFKANTNSPDFCSALTGLIDLVFDQNIVEEGNRAI